MIKTAKQIRNSVRWASLTIKDDSNLTDGLNEQEKQLYWRLKKEVMWQTPPKATKKEIQAYAWLFAQLVPKVIKAESLTIEMCEYFVRCVLFNVQWSMFGTPVTTDLNGFDPCSVPQKARCAMATRTSLLGEKMALRYF